jgi:hypothetical protein
VGFADLFSSLLINFQTATWINLPKTFFQGLEASTSSFSGWTPTLPEFFFQG